MGIHLKGILITFLVLLPNALFLLGGPRHVPSNLAGDPILFTIVERIGQAACFTLPVVLGKKIAEQKLDWTVLLMGICLAIYYLCWIRYFTGGREFSLLFQPLGFIPIPMAVFPILYFVLLGIWLRSPLFIVAAVLLAFGHFANTWHVYTQVQ